MKRLVPFIAVSGLLALAACASKTTPTSSTGKTSISEDLALYRPRYSRTASVGTLTRPLPAPGIPSGTGASTAVPSEQPLHITRRLDMVLDTLALRNRSVKYAQGYRIQLYTGASRQEADAVKINVYQLFPELNVYLTYSAPSYRLRVGDFVNRLDVERYHDALKNPYPNAMILADRVEIRKSLLTK